MNYDTSIFYGYPVSDGCYFWTSAKFYEDYRDSFDAGFIHRPFSYCGFNDPTVVACCYVPTTNRPQIIDDCLVNGPVPALRLSSGASMHLPLLSFSRLIPFETEESLKKSLKNKAQNTAKELMHK